MCDKLHSIGYMNIISDTNQPWLGIPMYDTVKVKSAIRKIHTYTFSIL